MIMALIVMAVVGLVAWLLTSYVPMPEPIKMIIIVFAALVILLYGLRALGVSLP